MPSIELKCPAHLFNHICAHLSSPFAYQSGKVHAKQRFCRVNCPFFHVASFGAPTAFMHPFPIWCTHIYAPPPHLVRPHLCTPSPFKVPIALLHPLPIQCGTRTCAPTPHSVRHLHLCTSSPFSAALDPFSAPTALVHPLPIQCADI
jgi:hypothetical protein